MTRAYVTFKTSLPQHSLTSSEKTEQNDRIMKYHLMQEKVVRPDDILEYFILKPSNTIISKAELKVINQEYFNLMNSYQDIARKFNYRTSLVKQIVDSFY